MNNEKSKRKARIGKLITHIVLILGALLILVPFAWMILTAFKSNAEALKIPLTIFPKDWTMENFDRVFQREIGTAYMNTLFVSAMIVFFQLLTASMAAYAFARLSFPLKNVIFISLLALLMVPAYMTIIPKYRLVSNLGLVDSLWGIIVPNMISVTITFFLRQTFATFPKELEEAAKMDGGGHIRIFGMVLRLNTSALTAMGVLVLLFAWNDLLWPTMVTTSTDKRVLSVFIALTQSGFGNEYGYLMAAGVLAILPLIVIYLICQKAFLTSIAMSGIKD